MAQLSGKDGDVKFSTTTLKVTEWSCTITKESLEVTNKASSGNRQYIQGLTGAEFSCKAIWDIDLQGSGVPPYTLVAPQSGVSVTLQIGDAAETDGQSVLTFTAVVEQLEITSAVEGVIEYSLSGKASGAITHTVNS